MFRRRSRSTSILGRIFALIKPIMAIVVLSAFVLLISGFIKFLATNDTSKMLSMVKPLFTKLNVDTAILDNVAGVSTKRVAPVKSVEVASEPVNQELSAVSAREPDFKIGLLADSHSNYDNLTKALDQAKEHKVDSIVFLGDYTELGVIEDLNIAKSTMDKAKITYYSLPGDHDLWKTVGPANFLEVFSKNYFTFEIGEIKFVGLDNSANFTPVSDELMTWFKNELPNADIVILSQPIYTGGNDRQMGVVNGEETPAVLEQANEILALIRGTNVQAVVSADLHKSSVVTDGEKPELRHYVIGALTDVRNLQSPRFSIFNIYSDSSWDIQEVLLK